MNVVVLWFFIQHYDLLVKIIQVLPFMDLYFSSFEQKCIKTICLTRPNKSQNSMKKTGHIDWSKGIIKSIEGRGRILVSIFYTQISLCFFFIKVCFFSFLPHWFCCPFISNVEFVFFLLTTSHTQNTRCVSSAPSKVHYYRVHLHIILSLIIELQSFVNENPHIINRLDQ